MEDFYNKTLIEILEENKLRFGDGSCIEQLERAKRGTDYDFMTGAVKQNFIFDVKTILYRKNDSLEIKIKEIEKALNKYHFEFVRIAENSSQFS